MKAMIFAAGLGTRLKPLTDTKPKALVEIGGKSFLEIIIGKLIRSGVNEIVVNIHHKSEMIKEYLKAKNNFGIKIILSDETHQLLDTGGGLKKAAPFLLGDEPVIIHNVDILTDLDLTKVVEFHLEKKALATIVGRYRETQRYFLTDSQGYLTGWENKKTGEQRIVGNKNFANTAPLAFSGIHVINPEFLRLIKQEGKFSIIDTYLDLAQNHKIIAFTDNSSFWMDIGKTDELEKANRMVAEGTVRI